MITLTVEVDQEEDGRWLAEVLDLPGVLAYGQSQDAAASKVQALALRVVVERLEHGEADPQLLSISFRAARARLPRIGWAVKRQSGSHRTLSRTGWADFVFAFHEDEEIGPRMLARIAKRTGLEPADLYRPLRRAAIR